MVRVFADGELVAHGARNRVIVCAFFQAGSSALPSTVMRPSAQRHSTAGGKTSGLAGAGSVFAAGFGFFSSTDSQAAIKKTAAAITASVELAVEK